MIAKVLTFKKKMKMKKIFYSLAVTMLLTAGTVITSCNSPSNKTNDSNEMVEEALRDLEEQKADAELKRQKMATAEEWEAFKSESEIKIKENEIRIEELKQKMMKPGVGLDSLRQNRINNLEEKNSKLKSKDHGIMKAIKAIGNLLNKSLNMIWMNWAKLLRT